jgi:ABC-2 type transport system permease protein
MISWGAMSAVIAGGARIAAERAVGWSRQLRITPLPSWAYVGTKVLTGYLMAFVTIALMYVAGAALGVRMAAGDWVLMTLLVLVGLAPFAALGIAFGHLLTIDSMGPALGGTTALMAVLGGSWGPIASAGWLHGVALALPSYWLVQAGQVGLHGGSWSRTAWLVIAIWSLGLMRLALWAFRRDTKRV